MLSATPSNLKPPATVALKRLTYAEYNAVMIRELYMMYRGRHWEIFLQNNMHQRLSSAKILTNHFKLHSSYKDQFFINFARCSVKLHITINESFLFSINDLITLVNLSSDNSQRFPRHL